MAPVGDPRVIHNKHSGDIMVPYRQVKEKRIGFLLYCVLCYSLLFFPFLGICLALIKTHVTHTVLVYSLLPCLFGVSDFKSVQYNAAP